MMDTSRSKGQLIQELLKAQRRIVELEQSAAERRHDEEPASVNRRIYVILESIQDGFFAMDRNWCFTYVNRRSAEQLGCKPADLLGQNAWEKFPQLIGTDHYLFALKAMEERQAQYYEAKGVITDTWYGVTVNPAAEGVSVYWQDITKRKRIEETLRKSEERYRRITENMSDAISEIDAEGRFVYASPSHFKLLGYNPEDLVGTSIFDGLHPDDRDHAMDVYTQGVRSKTAHELELRYRNANGRYIWIRASGQPLFNEAGEYIGGVINASNITKRKQVEKELKKYQDRLEELVEERTAELKEMNAALKESEAKYRFLTESMSDTIWTTDEHMKLTYMSPSVGKARGFTPEEVSNQKMADYLTPESYAKAMKIMQGELERIHVEGIDPERTITVELEYYHKNGSTVWIQSVLKGIYDESGRFIGVHGVGRDITEWKRADEERKKLESQLMHMQKIEALDRFAGGIAHDLNNILYPIIINTEHLLSEAPRGSDRYEILNQILKASYRQRDLIRQILTFSRKHVTNFIPMKTGPLIEEVISFLRSSLPRTIEIDYRTRAKTDVIMGDPTQIQQVILNLCQNAADSMESRTGTIEIRLSNTHMEPMTGYPDIQAGEYMKLTVRDTGSGMSKEVMSRIFEPFFTTKHGEKGTGMGLSVVHGIIKGHKGAVTVSSREGKGSLFTVYLQVCDEECRARAGFVEKTASVPGKGKVLLVDDEEAILVSIRRTLKTFGYQVVALKDGLAALELFEKMCKDFDLVITDMTMPGLTGLELSKKMQDIRSDVPIILCTGFSDVIDRDKARDIGIRELLMKPVGIRELGDVIRRALET